MLAYEIHVTGDRALDDAERVRAVLARACGEPIDRPVRIEEDHSLPVLALLLPSSWPSPASPARALMREAERPATARREDP
jgi:hypothetical protein